MELNLKCIAFGAETVQGPKLDETYISVIARDGTPYKPLFSGHEDVVCVLLKPQHRLPTSGIAYPGAVMAGLHGGGFHLYELLLGVGERMLPGFTELEIEIAGISRFLCSQIMEEWTFDWDEGITVRNSGTGSTPRSGGVPLNDRYMRSELPIIEAKETGTSLAK
ncbi:hypothetical protein F4781DRAFT_431031 [Annulohypoxylon bovei var. microspora]|nr:hypothetical protein F4781DRAFT_431031 [Annulohypoxylon bovei var. microspora]